MNAARFLSMLVVGCSTLSAPAMSWGWQGHEYIGTIAWDLLNPNARAHVTRLLGPDMTLAEAAVWPDCVRDVHPVASGYKMWFGPKSPKVCKGFSPAQQDRMVDYATRNWTNCEYSDRQAECHKAYHFADINVVDHPDYDAADFGAHPYDVVHAIEAATAVLKCKAHETCTAPAPFNIADKKEALLLLAHFVGDVHQPLHVGAVYLDTGAQEAPGDTAQETIGGNSLLLSASSNLHGMWDSVTNATPKPDAIAQACQIAPLPNPTPEPPEQWASESVAAARRAYSGMSFAPDSKVGYWDVMLSDPAGYAATKKVTQQTRLIQAGARLASILNSVWPSRTKAAACR